jgi:serine/threonine protein kinase
MIIKGLDYIHKKGLIFKDLNCGRIYYNSNNGVVSIGDIFVSSEIFYKTFNEKIYGNLKFNNNRNFPTTLYGA